MSEYDKIEVENGGGLNFHTVVMESYEPKVWGFKMTGSKVRTGDILKERLRRQESTMIRTGTGGTILANVLPWKEKREPIPRYWRNLYRCYYQQISKRIRRRRQWAARNWRKVR